VRTRHVLPMLGSLLLLLAACADQRLTSLDDPTFSKKPGGITNAPHEVLLLGGRASLARAINENGVIVGWGRNASGHERPLRWIVDAQGGVAGPEELALPDDGVYGYAEAVNGAGLVVGYSRYDHQGGFGNAFLHDGTSARRLTVPAHALSSRAGSINDAGVAVGDVELALEERRVWRGVVWLDPLDPGAQPLELPPLEGADGSAGRWINNAGVIGGWSSSGTGSVQVYWTLSADGVLQGPWPLSAGLNAYAMNDAPAFVGIRNSHATLLRGGTLTTLGALSGDTESWATGLNNPRPSEALQVVGNSGWGTGSGRPVLWQVAGDGTVTGPLALALPRSHARGSGQDVNGRGWIVGLVQNNPDDRVAALWRVQDDGGKQCKAKKC
jgi:hypothetical protein